jgi:hypothetical protein
MKGVPWAMLRLELEAIDRSQEILGGRHMS